MTLLIEKLKTPEFSASLREKNLEDILAQIHAFDSRIEINEATKLLSNIICRLHLAGILTYPDLRRLNPDTLFIYLGEEIFHQIATNRFATMSSL